jgi:hypothetical protein
VIADSITANLRTAAEVTRTPIEGAKGPADDLLWHKSEVPERINDVCFCG